MKCYLSTQLSSSKSDGDLLRQNTIKKCAPLDHVIKDNEKQDFGDQTNGLSATSNGEVDHFMEKHTLSEQNSSLYYSTTTAEEKDSNVSSSPQEMISSMTSSATTIIQEETGSDEEEENTEDSISDNITFGRTLKEFGSNSRCRQDSSSYEHLAASMNELSHTGDPGGGNLDDCNNLDKPCDIPEEDTKVTSKDANLTKEISIQTTENQKTINNQETQTNDSITTIRLTLPTMYARYLDNDGLTFMHNDVQDRLRQIEMLYQERMEALHTQVLEERRRRLVGNGDMCSAGRNTDLNDEVVSSTSPLCGQLKRTP